MASVHVCAYCSKLREGGREGRVKERHREGLIERVSECENKREREREREKIIERERARARERESQEQW